MTDVCECGRANECDGETAIYYPLQDGGMCSVRSCFKPKKYNYEEILHDAMDYCNE